MDAELGIDGAGRREDFPGRLGSGFEPGIIKKGIDLFAPMGFEFVMQAIGIAGQLPAIAGFREGPGHKQERAGANVAR